MNCYNFFYYQILHLSILKVIYIMISKGKILRKKLNRTSLMKLLGKVNVLREMEVHHIKSALAGT